MEKSRRFIELPAFAGVFTRKPHAQVVGENTNNGRGARILVCDYRQIPPLSE